MVAYESLSMRMTVFPKLWFGLMSSTSEQQAGGEDFIGLLCNSCNYFREYISLILLQDKDFLQHDVVFELIKHCLPKVSVSFWALNFICDSNRFFDFHQINPPLVTPPFISKMISMECSINLDLEEEHFVKNYIEMIGVSQKFLRPLQVPSTVH